MDPATLHRQLLTPGPYPEPTGGVTCRETHISRVYLTDRFAYKLKKPLDLGFLDFSTLEKRRYFCGEEVRLNRRFAPDVYLGVVELRGDAQGVHFGGTGPLLDYAVKMRRLPEDRMLGALLERDDPELPRLMTCLAAHLAALLAGADVCSGEGGAAAVHANVTGNLRQSESAIGRALSAAAHQRMLTRTRTAHARLTPLMEQRAAGGFVRDGHGDLHAANICMTDPIRVYDCIEFCRSFRVADVAADLAFLLMDLEFRDRRDLAGIFLDHYQRHVRDPGLSELLPFYKAHRAWVRGKVESLLASEADVPRPQRQQALSRARRYFNLALGYHVPVTLVLTCGLMGVGKSTLAGALARATGARLLRSDVVRKELAGLPLNRPSPATYGSGLYSAQMTARTYAELQLRAADCLQRGEAVIVDASFARPAERQAFLALAAAARVPALFLHLTCAAEEALARLDRRQQLANDPSDGRRELYHSQAAAFAPFAAGTPRLEIDSSQPVDYTVQTVLCELLTP